MITNKTKSNLDNPIVRYFATLPFVVLALIVAACSSDSIVDQVVISNNETSSIEENISIGQNNTPTDNDLILLKTFNFTCSGHRFSIILRKGYTYNFSSSKLNQGFKLDLQDRNSIVIQSFSTDKNNGLNYTFQAPETGVYHLIGTGITFTGEPFDPKVDLSLVDL